MRDTEGIAAACGALPRSRRRSPAARRARTTATSRILGNKLSIAMANAGHDHGKGHHKKGVVVRLRVHVVGRRRTSQLDCDDPFPNNEPDIEVDPANPLHMIASSNDYGSCCDECYTTFDGGATWSTGNISTGSRAGPTGSDPVTSFDTKHHVALHASLNYFFNDDFTRDVRRRRRRVAVEGRRPQLGSAGRRRPGRRLRPRQEADLQRQGMDRRPTTTSTRSSTAGRTSRGRSSSRTTASSCGRRSSSRTATTAASTGRKAQEISGSNKELCTFQTTGHDGQCDEGTSSRRRPSRPDGTVYVAFLNPQNESLWEPGEVFDDQYLLVKSKDGGEHWSKPTFVVGLEDGSNDYPLNVDGRQTLSGYQVRVWSLGNIVASPNDGTLYLTFSDNRNGIHDVANPVTNTDVFVMSSSDGGKTWSDPSRVDAGGGDQWFPWVDVNPVTGTIGVLVQRPRRVERHVLRRRARRGDARLASSKTTLSTAPSDPVHSIFFQAGGRPGVRAVRALPRRLHQRRLRKRRPRERRRGRTCGSSSPTPISDGRASLQFIDFARK